MPPETPDTSAETPHRDRLLLGEIDRVFTDLYGALLEASAVSLSDEMQQALRRRIYSLIPPMLKVEPVTVESGDHAGREEDFRQWLKITVGSLLECELDRYRLGSC